MSEPFLGQISIVAFNFAPRGYAFCDGQILPISQNQSLYSLLGTTYGGDGRTTFALPDLRGRVPVHFGDFFLLGSKGGEEMHTLNLAEMASHSHAAIASSNVADLPSPTNNFWASQGQQVYANNSNAQMAPEASPTATGGSQAHENLSPYLVLGFCIALSGLFPSRN